jgi:hypothetical protein
VWVSIPVAGTTIEQYNLVGAWSATMVMDGAASPAASASFSLN